MVGAGRLQVAGFRQEVKREREGVRATLALAAGRARTAACTHAPMPHPPGRVCVHVRWGGGQGGERGGRGAVCCTFFLCWMRQGAVHA